MMGVTNAQIIEAIKRLRDDDLAEIKHGLKEMNGRVRETEQAMAALFQWQADQENAMATVEEEQVRLRERQNHTSIILGVAQFIVAAVGAILFGRDGQI